MEKLIMHIAKERRQSEKGCIWLYDFNYDILGKQNYGHSQKISAGRNGIEEGTEDYDAAQYYNDGYMSLYTCPNQGMFNTKNEP